MLSTGGVYMIKWKSWLAVTAVSLGLIGCAPAADEARDTAYHGAGMNGARGLATDDAAGLDMNWNNKLNANINDQAYNYPRTYANNSMFKDGNMAIRGTNNRNWQYGWASYSKRDMNIQQANTFYVDRNVLARAISTVVTSVPGIDRASVLVTDEDIFIGVPGVTDVATLNKAKLSAWSMSPRWYKIYITGNKGMIDQVSALVANSNGLDQDRLDRILQDKTIMDMTGTNVTDNGQNITNYNINKTFPNTNGTHLRRDR